MEDHAGQHAACAPDVKLVVVMGHSHEQLGPLEVPRGHPAVELFARRVEVCEPPIGDSDLSAFVIYEHVARLDVPVNYSF